MIQSDYNLASTYAQDIMDKGNSLLNSSQATKDSTSTIGGNGTASSKIDKEYSLSHQIGTQSKAFVSLIQSVASEFVAVDNQISQTISSSNVSSDSSTDVTDFTPNYSLFKGK